MRTEQVYITYRLTFESAFHFGTGLRDGLINRVVARDADGLLYVPGSTLKGVVRERCEQVAIGFGFSVVDVHATDWREAATDIDVVTRTFGSRFHPGHLYFDDVQMIDEDRKLFGADSASPLLEAEFKNWQTEERTQVSVSRVTGTAQSGRLFTSEYGIRDLRFDGQVTGMLTGIPLQCFYATGLGAGTYPLLLLVVGLLSLDRLGGSKSAGAGKVMCRLKELRVDGQPVSVKALVDELPALDQEIYALCKEEVLG